MTVERVKLAKVVDVKGGKRLPAGASFSSEPTAHPYIRGQDIRGGRIRASDQLYITETVFEKIRRYTVRGGDVCVTIVGNIGDVGVTPPELDGANLTENAVKLIPTTSKLDSQFLAYALLSPEVQQQMKLSAAGAAQPKLGIYKVNEIEIPFPAVESQRRIASILAGYDDLIENNTLRIAILEEMARRIYEEWFVRFRFPCHEGQKLVESELGLVPEGWRVVPLADMVDTQYGYTESAQDKPIGPKFLRGMDINKQPYIDWSAVPYCPIHPDELPKFKLSMGDVVVIRMADPGKIGIVEKEIDAVFASYLVRLRITDQRMTPYFLFYFLTGERYQGYITGVSTGTTRKSASAPVITGLKVVMPTYELMMQFNEYVVPLRRLLNMLLDKNSNLRTTRDLLLPKLISGDLDLSAVPESEALTA